MQRLLYLLLFLIAYGSLYPFNFDAAAWSAQLRGDFFNFNAFYSTRGDVVGNLLLFLPVGFLMVHISRLQQSPWPHFALWLLIGVSGAGALQFLQMLLSGRDAWAGDVIWNLVGLLLGAVVSLAFKPEQLQTLLKRIDFPLVLAMGLVMTLLLPLIPTFDLQVVKDTIKSAVQHRQMDVFLVYLHMITWAAIFFFLRESAASGSGCWYYLLLLPIVIGLQLVLLHNPLTLSELVGAVLGMFVCLVPNKRMVQVLVQVMLIIAIVVYPFEFWNRADERIIFSGKHQQYVQPPVMLFLFYEILSWLLLVAASAWLFINWRRLYR